MWARNLLFIGLLVGGAVALKSSLFPPPAPPRVKNFHPDEPATEEIHEVAAKVDAAFRAEWTKQNLTPAPRAADLTVARRLSLALAGTVPSLQEVRQFEAYPEKERLQWWVVGLLQDRRYGNYIGERLARTYVGVEDGPFIIYRRHRFVEWLSDELMKNESYGVIAQHLISEQGLWTDRPATNFVTVTYEENAKRKGFNAEKLAGRVARAFLGVRLDCAQCHDHFFDPRWKQKHFQGLAAFFGQTHQSFSGVRDTGEGEHEMENRKTKKWEVVAPEVPFGQELLPMEGSRRERLARWVTHPRNRYFSRAAVQRVWALMFGRPMLDTIEAMGPGEEPEPLRILADDFRDHNYDLQRLIRIIAATEVFQLDSDSAADQEITTEHEKAYAVFPISALRPEQVAGSIVQAGSVQTINTSSNILVRATRAGDENAFVKRYGDTGADEFNAQGGTIPQALLMMNGDLVHGKTREDFGNAVSRIAIQAPNDRAAIEAAYLATLTRRPSPEEMQHFTARLADGAGKERKQRLLDLYWALINATEFSCNH